MSEMKRYRIYNVILSNIKDADADNAFFKYVTDNKLEWWRHTPLNWILVTPFKLYTNDLVQAAMNAYGINTPIFVLEINILDIGGVAPGFTKNPDPKEIATPFGFFHKIQDAKYKFPWER